MVALFNAAYNLSVYAKALAYFNYLLGMFGAQIYLETVTHVEHLVHLAPVGAALLLDGLEQWGHREQVVLDYSFVLYKVHYFGLCTSRAVYHTVYLRAKCIEQFLYDGSIGACGRQYQFACIERRVLYIVCQA